MGDKKGPQAGANGASQEPETRACPKCGAKMIKGEFRGGTSHGRSAWACTNFPKCGHIDVVRTPIEQALIDRLKRGFR